MKNNKLFVLMLAMAMQSANATLPVTFISGSVIKASEINANFQYLESLISSAAQSSVTSYVKASIAFANNTGTAHTLYTVPTSASSNYIIRQLYLPPCFAPTLTVGSVVFPVSGGVSTGLSIPASAGESIVIRCSYNSSIEIAAIILSK